MSIARGLKHRLPLVIDHRELEYLDSLDDIISGKVSYTTHCTYRSKKWKQIRGRSKL